VWKRYPPIWGRDILLPTGSEVWGGKPPPRKKCKLHAENVKFERELK